MLNYSYFHIIYVKVWICVSLSRQGLLTHIFDVSVTVFVRFHDFWSENLSFYRFRMKRVYRSLDRISFFNNLMPFWIASVWLLMFKVPLIIKHVQYFPMASFYSYNKTYACCEKRKCNKRRKFHFFSKIYFSFYMKLIFATENLLTQ